MKQVLFRAIFIFLEPFIVLALSLCALIARFSPKAIDVGLGPLPLINNIYHKKVFEKCGFSAETFVDQVWFISNDFDVRTDKLPFKRIPIFGHYINNILLIIWCFFRYRCVLVYFNGGPIGVLSSTCLWRLEPFLFLLAGVKTIVLPYGSDVQVMSRSPNLNFKNAMAHDYPGHVKKHKRIADKIDLWSAYGSHVVGGCEWVDYMHHWDSLMISHFSIDTDLWVNGTPPSKSKTFKVFHAPNHKSIKGSQHVIDAIDALQEEGLDIELVMVEKRPNAEVRVLIESADLVIDQLIIGWYAMFAIEAMALEKPVICYLRDDLKNLYKTSGLIGCDEEIPLISASALDVKDKIRDLYNDQKSLKAIGREGREYVLRHHSIEAIAAHFKVIVNDVLGDK